MRPDSRCSGVPRTSINTIFGCIMKIQMLRFFGPPYSPAQLNTHPPSPSVLPLFAFQLVIYVQTLLITYLPVFTINVYLPQPLYKRIPKNICLVRSTLNVPDLFNNQVCISAFQSNFDFSLRGNLSDLHKMFLQQIGPVTTKS